MTTEIATHRAGQATRAPRLTGRHRPGTDDQPENGRRLIPADKRVPADYMPPSLTPAVRQALAPTHYANRALHAGPDDRTGVLDPTSLEVTQ